MAALLNRLFEIDTRKSTSASEVRGGGTTFLTMAYILFANPAILHAAGVPLDAAIAIAHAMHRHPRYYEAPDEFKPERWEGDLIKRLPKFCYFPFSHGPRQCIGNTFATMEAKLILATMIQRFHFELAPGEVVRPKFSISLNPEHGIKMVLTPRHPLSPLAAHAVRIPAASP